LTVTSFHVSSGNTDIVKNRILVQTIIQTGPLKSDETAIIGNIFINMSNALIINVDNHNMIHYIYICNSTQPKETTKHTLLNEDIIIN